MQKSDIDSTTSNLQTANTVQEPRLSSFSEEISVEAAPRLDQSEIRRKALHMLPGVAPFLLAVTPHGPTMLRKDLIFVSVVIIIFTSLFLFFRKHVEREGETNLLSTVYTYGAVVAAVLFLFREHAEFASVVTVIIAFGDSAAHIGGKLFGKTKLPWNPDKSWMGMFCFILFSAPFAALVFYMESRPSTTIQLAIACGFIASIAGCLAESINTTLTDNLRVGVASAAGVAISFFALQGILA